MVLHLGPPDVGAGEMIELPGRGTAFVRDLPGPSPDSPTVLLLHGWCVTADVNWGTAYAALAKSFRVIALDQRGHGRGIRGNVDFAACADDAALLLHVLRVERAVVVGYSMGGPIALEVFARHRHRVRGLVLAATSLDFAPSAAERAQFRALRALARGALVLPDPVANRLLARVVYREAGDRFGPWVLEQIGSGDLRGLLAAGGELGRFNGFDRAAMIDVPTTVVVTEHDTVVDPDRQRAVARAVPNAMSLSVAGDHDVGLVNPDALNPVLLAAVAAAGMS